LPGGKTLLMPVFFPDPEDADETGLLAMGGNLEPETLLQAYQSGIFPWFSKKQPILWWSPDPRMVLYPDKLRISHSLRQILRKGNFSYSFDTAFAEVIKSCAHISRMGQKGTWITSEMINAYIRLHQMGYAHSVETWCENRLAGGLYGLAIGKAFFGESMFHQVRDASKVALYYLVEHLKNNNFEIIDVQQSTAHLKSLGGEEIPRTLFLEKVRNACAGDEPCGSWKSYSA
jgi:leucyl/phenylalanyl-tRNA---protein transferase